MKSHFHPDGAQLTAALADRLETIAVNAVEERGVAFLAVPGGRSPRPVLAALAARALPWERIVLALTDERWVPLDEAASNEGGLRAILAPASGQPRIVGLYTGHATPEAGQATVEVRLADLPWPADAVLLGMGEDGHVASLFPDGAFPGPGNGRSMAARAPGPPVERISLTPQALVDAHHLFLMLPEEPKRAIFEATRADVPPPPVHRLLALGAERVEIHAVQGGGDQ